MPGQKKGSRKIGRNKQKCNYYSIAEKRLSNKASGLAKKVEKGSLSTNGMNPKLVPMIKKRIEYRKQVRKEVLHHVGLIKSGRGKIEDVPIKIRGLVEGGIFGRTRKWK